MNVILLLQFLILLTYLTYLTAKGKNSREFAVVPIDLKFLNIHKCAKTAFFSDFVLLTKNNCVDINYLPKVRQVTHFFLKSK